MSGYTLEKKVIHLSDAQQQEIEAATDDAARTEIIMRIVDAAEMTGIVETAELAGIVETAGISKEAWLETVQATATALKTEVQLRFAKDALLNVHHLLHADAPGEAMAMLCAAVTVIEGTALPDGVFKILCDKMFAVNKLRAEVDSAKYH